MGNREKSSLSLKALGEGLTGTKRKEYWRSLDQLAQTEEFNKWLEDEFPERQSLLSIDRRDFVKLMGASMLMASLAGCRSLPRDKIVAYSKAPEDQVPGFVYQYATSMTLGGYGFGLMVDSRQGRPAKIDGSPLHPATLGSSDRYLQGALYDMYDPDRSQSVRNGEDLSDWDEFNRFILPELDKVKGSEIRVLTGTVTSPTTARLVNKFLAKYPGAKWHQYEPVNEDHAIAGAELAFGQAVQPVFDFTKANVVVSLDADFLSEGPGSIRYARDFSSKRHVENQSSTLNRHYAVHSAATVTSAASDHRLAVKPSKVETIARGLAGALSGSGAGAAGEHKAWVEAVAADLQANRGASIIVVGANQPPIVHAIGHMLNSMLGNIGSTVQMINRVTEGDASQLESLTDLVAALDASTVKVLLILGANPVYSAPVELKFAEAMAKADLTIHMGTHFDETAALANWHLPEAHFLEAWGDSRAFDGTLTLQQPLIAPLYSGRSINEILEKLSGGAKLDRDLVMETHGAALGAMPLGMKTWERWIHDGLVASDKGEVVAVSANPNVLNQPAGTAGADLELALLPDPTVYDGRFGNNAWLQELPKPMSSTTWDNAVMLSPVTAKKLGVNTEDMVEVSAGGQAVKGPALVVPGQADDTVVVHLGYGRRSGGQICEGTSRSMPQLTNKMFGLTTVGFDAYPLLFGDGFGKACAVKKVGGKSALAMVQVHHQMDGMDIVRSGTMVEFAENPTLKPEHGHEFPEDQTFYSQTDKDQEGQANKWAMTIDLGLCIGCNACTIACQAENNIPSVGKEQVARGREMHWIRVDRYMTGSAESPAETLFHPVPCMHCENAPCEPVCPVAATVHSKEGLNQMVYNRCVGTRYCSNNCPYKVRRFNFLNYADKTDKASIRLLNNPDVTVRGRGVMEKCTFCVQRINKARITAKKEGREIKDGEVVTACQAACPTKAIVFGNLNDPNSAISKSKANVRNYSLLKELNTRPRTTYLGRVRNTNPAVEALEPKVNMEEAH